VVEHQVVRDADEGHGGFLYLQRGERGSDAREHEQEADREGGEVSLFPGAGRRPRASLLPVEDLVDLDRILDALDKVPAVELPFDPLLPLAGEPSPALSNTG